MTNAEILAEMKSDSLLSRARVVFASEWARIEQAGSQRRRPSIFEVRQMEFEAVRKIAEVLGVEV
jgi:hypothetical protein